VTLVVMALFVTNCGSSSSGRTAIPVRPSTAATLQILAPTPNAHTGSRVRVSLRLDHAHLVPATQVGGILRPDEGHIHLSLDGQLVAMPSQLTDPLPLLRAGGHTVEAEFVASDHLPFADRVVAAVTFTVA
jgi:hypothetical protein